VAYGERTFQDRYRDAVQRTSLNYQTLRNYVWVARRFDLPRRHDGLSFGHHAEVAALDQPEQDYWLRKAEELKWSRNRLRSEVRSSLQQRRLTRISFTTCETSGREKNEDNPGNWQEPDQGVPDQIGDRTLKMRLTAHQFTQFTIAADKRNQQLEEWALQVLQAAV
jgi:hypothetical protein